MIKPDMRDREDIKRIFKEKAESYTPEWNMNTDDPDIAAALALVCTDMFENTMKRINALPVKNIIAFHNTFNASLLPASPSMGYVSFSLSSSDLGSTEVPGGTVLSSYSKDGTTVRFETGDDILVSPCHIECAFCVDDKADHICEYPDIISSRTDLFELCQPNIQTHVLKIVHPYAFNLQSHGKICVKFCHMGGTGVKAEFIQALADVNATRIEYFDENERFSSFSSVYEKNGCLYLVLENSDPPFKKDENGFVIRITVKDISVFEGFSFSFAEAYPSGEGIEADSLTNGNLDLEKKSFFPFGERFQLFNEIYFGCSEVLDKRGAEINISFDLSLTEVPIENQLIDDGINWKWVAKKSDFTKMPEYKISITNVIWEYYNGSGWCRLFPDSSYSEMFNYKQGAEKSFQSMNFKCPDDICELFVGARSGYYIRARVLSAENLYKLKGVYMSPNIRNLSFSYSYRENGCRILEMNAMNNLEIKDYSVVMQKGESFRPFIKTGIDKRTVYLGLSHPPEKGPMRIFWDIMKKPVTQKNELIWEYYTADGWKAMNIADETEGFSRSGVTVILDNSKPVSKRLFDRELYWIRLIDAGNVFREVSPEYPICIGVQHNSVMAYNVDGRKEEIFSMNVYLENTEIELSSGNIMELSLYVNETSTITDAEIDVLKARGKLVVDNKGSGLEKSFWVLWEETDSFISKNNTSRCYILDRRNGLIKFGNGRNGRIPSVFEPDNIRVKYTIGGGKHTNALPGTINTIERSIGFVTGVTNPASFYGGCDEENLYEAVKRCRVMMRTQGKVITRRDLEELAFYSSRNVKRVKCFAGLDINGEKRKGAVTIVVQKKENSDFSRIKNEILRNLMPILPLQLAGSGLLQIIEPVNIIVNIRAEIRVKSLDGVFSLKRNVEECLESFINAFSGDENDSDWKLGRIPNEYQVRSAISKLANIDYIKNIHVNTYVQGNGGLNEIDEEGIQKLYYVMPGNGLHDIIVSLT